MSACLGRSMVDTEQTRFRPALYPPPCAPFSRKRERREKREREERRERERKESEKKRKSATFRKLIITCHFYLLSFPLSPPPRVLLARVTSTCCSCSSTFRPSESGEISFPREIILHTWRRRQEEGAHLSLLPPSSSSDFQPLLSPFDFTYACLYSSSVKVRSSPATRT